MVKKTPETTEIPEISSNKTPRGGVNFVKKFCARFFLQIQGPRLGRDTAMETNMIRVKTRLFSCGVIFHHFRHFLISTYNVPSGMTKICTKHAHDRTTITRAGIQKSLNVEISKKELTWIPSSS